LNFDIVSHTKVVLQTRNTSGTIQIGKSIGSLLLPGDVVALVGELGTGKTQFIKGLAVGVGIGKPTYISSPSFTLINEYKGKIPFYHIDLFRLRAEKEAEDLGLEEYFQSGGITAIEWADRIPSLLPREMLWIQISYTGENTRSIEILGRGKRYEELINRLRIADCGITVFRMVDF
jgi:tRNA threonylcarbamoyladenosine biosynthesis protein TsaE